MWKTCFLVVVALELTAAMIVKPGQCGPSEPPPGIVTPCFLACSNDGDCQGARKCCAYGCSAQCSDPIIVQPLPPPRLTCANVRCRSGTTCVDTPTGPECIPTKPGSCPSLPYICPTYPSGVVCRPECASDFACPGDQKCCADCSPCKMCKPAILPIFTPSPPFLCDKPCAPGYECVDTGIRCITTPCPTYQCVRVGPCSLPPETGPCKAAFKRYYYDARGPSPGCRTFTYGGCGGNSNNFLSLGDCVRACARRSNRGRNDD